MLVLRMAEQKCIFEQRYSPDVGQHEYERADYDGLQNLPVPTEGSQSWHEQLPGQHHEVCHHGHGEAPSRQTQLDPCGPKTHPIRVIIITQTKAILK